jgi:hypothetical protein
MTRGNSWQFVAIRGHQWQLVAISGNQWQMVAISGHQWRSSIQWHQPHTCPEASSIATQKQEPGELR